MIETYKTEADPIKRVLVMNVHRVLCVWPQLDYAKSAEPICTNLGGGRGGTWTRKEPVAFWRWLG